MSGGTSRCCFLVAIGVLKLLLPVTLPAPPSSGLETSGSVRANAGGGRPPRRGAAAWGLRCVIGRVVIPVGTFCRGCSGACGSLRTILPSRSQGFRAVQAITQLPGVRSSPASHFQGARVLSRHSTRLCAEEELGRRLWGLRCPGLRE